MNAATGTWQLRRVIIRNSVACGVDMHLAHALFAIRSGYSETGGSSLGTRFYLRHLLPVWKATRGGDRMNQWKSV